MVHGSYFREPQVLLWSTACFCFVCFFINPSVQTGNERQSVCLYICWSYVYVVYACILHMEVCVSICTTCVKTRSWCLVSSPTTPILLFEIGSLDKPDAHQLADLLASQQPQDQPVSTWLPVLGLQAWSATPGFSLGCWGLWNRILMITQQTLYPSLQPLDCVCLIQTKYAVQDSWQGTIFLHSTSTVEKPPVLPEWRKSSTSQKETRVENSPWAPAAG